jgi:tetratricopeptide (TPR) repeat protein
MIDRLGILPEHDDAGGVLLWRLVRDVELWAGTPVAKRSELFSPGAREVRTARLRESTVPTDIRVLLRSLNRILGGAPDTPGIEEDAAHACAGVAQWAREMDAPETAVAYAQAAALCSDRARHALLTGVCAREAGQGARAVSWFNRAVALARREPDRRSYAVAFLALGDEAEAAGDTGAARKRYLRAARTARRSADLDLERGRAAYGLFRLAKAAGDTEAADAYARAATSAVMKSQPAAAGLELALAAFWTEHGNPGRVVRILDRLAKLDALPAHERLPAAILRVRATTRTGNLPSARRSWADAWAVAGSAAPGPQLAKPLLELAECAAALGEPGGVEEAGRAALTQASEEDYPRIRAAVLALADVVGGSAAQDAA